MGRPRPVLQSYRRRLTLHWLLVVFDVRRMIRVERVIGGVRVRHLPAGMMVAMVMMAVLAMGVLMAMMALAVVHILR